MYNLYKYKYKFGKYSVSVFCLVYDKGIYITFCDIEICYS